MMATWPSGKAEACKAFTTGSNPVVASIELNRLESKGFQPFLFVLQCISLRVSQWGYTAGLSDGTSARRNFSISPTERSPGVHSTRSGTRPLIPLIRHPIRATCNTQVSQCNAHISQANKKATFFFRRWLCIFKMVSVEGFEPSPRLKD